MAGMRVFCHYHRYDCWLRGFLPHNRCWQMAVSGVCGAPVVAAATDAVGAGIVAAITLPARSSGQRKWRKHTKRRPKEKDGQHRSVE